VGKEENMKRTGLVRWGGLAAMVGGVIFAVDGSLGGPEAVGTLRWSTVLFLLSMMVLIVALHLLQKERERYGPQGAVVSATAFVGVALAVVSYILMDFVISLESLGITLFLLGLLVATPGIIALGVITLVVEVLPRWSGAALICGNPLLGLFFILIFYAENFALGSLLVAVPWIVVGFAVFRAASHQTQQPSRVR
jgi:hypothetical protein